MKPKGVKDTIIKDLTRKINEHSHLYLTDISELNAEDTGELRRKCFENNIRLEVVKNTLIKKALKASDKELSNGFEDNLKNSTSIMFCETGNAGAKLIKEFRKKHEKPILKAAYVEESFYYGDDQVETLAELKSKDELIGDIILQLQSPMNNVISALKSGQNKLTGALKTLSEKQ